MGQECHVGWLDTQPAPLPAGCTTCPSPGLLDVLLPDQSRARWGSASAGAGRGAELSVGSPSPPLHQGPHH